MEMNRPTCKDEPQSTTPPTWKVHPTCGRILGDANGKNVLHEDPITLT